VRSPCPDCTRRMVCDWDWHDAPLDCLDFRKDTRSYLLIPTNEEGFKQIKDRLCLVKLPQGRVFRGRPRTIDPENGIFVELDKEEQEFLVLEVGAPSEIYPLE